jgi:phosphoribosylaminoimidazole-succinocarboxamide synthase
VRGARLHLGIRLVGVPPPRHAGRGALPAGLQESQRLDPPIFSPATKAETGHDENITFDRMRDEVGDDVATS